MLDRARSARSAPSPAPVAGPRVGPGVGPAAARPGPLGGSNRERARALREGGASPPPELLALYGQELVGNEQTVEWCGLGRDQGAGGREEEGPEAQGAPRAEGGRRASAARPDASRDRRRSLVPHPERETEPGAAAAPRATASVAPDRPTTGPPLQAQSPGSAPSGPALRRAPGAGAGGAGLGTPAARGATRPPRAALGERPSSGPSPGAPAPALPAAPTPADPVVDHYMNVNWDRHAYDEACATFNVRPEGVGTLLEQAMPPGMSSEALLAADVSATILFSAADSGATLLAGEIPVVGVLYGAFTDLRGAAEGAYKVPRALDGEVVGAALRGYEGARGALSTGAKTFGYLADHLALLQDAVAAGATAVGVGAPITAPAAGAGGACVIGGLSVTGSGLRAVGTAFDLGAASLDTAATALALWRASEAEREGDFETAGAVRSWAQLHAVRALASWIGALLSAGAGMLGNFAPAEAGDGVSRGLLSFGTELMKAGKKASSAYASPLGKGTTSPAVDPDLGARLASWGLADVMTVADPPLRPPDVTPGGGGGAGLVSASRQRSAARLDAAWADLQADDPSWTPRLLATLRDPAQLGVWDLLFKATAPSGILELCLFGMGAPERAVAGAFLGVGGDAALDEVASLAAPLARAVDQLDDRLLEALPTIDVFVATREAGLRTWAAAREQLQAHRTQLDALEAGAAELEGGLGDARARARAVLTRLDATMDQLGLLSLLGGPARRAVDHLRHELVERLLELDEALGEGGGGVAVVLRSGRARLDGVLAEGGAGEQAMHLSIDEALGLRQEVEAFLTRWHDAGVRVDVGAFVAWAREQRRVMEELPRQVHTQAFLEHVERIAVPSVDSWRARHGAQVLDAFFPSVPPHELDAARAAWEHRRAELGALPALDRAWAAARAAATGQGPDAVEAFRAAVDQMLLVEAPPGGAAAAPTASPGAERFPEEAPVPPGAQPRG